MSAKWLAALREQRPDLAAVAGALLRAGAGWGAWWAWTSHLWACRQAVVCVLRMWPGCPHATRALPASHLCARQAGG